MSPAPDSSLDRLLRDLGRRLAADRQVRRKLPVWGRFSMDRPLPFLCVYRRPAGSRDEATFRLVTSEASYLIASAGQKSRKDLRRLLSAVAGEMTRKFGAFLILEIWAGKPPQGSGESAPEPGFRIFAPGDPASGPLTGVLQEHLGKIRLGRRDAAVSVRRGARRWPRGLPPVLPAEEAEGLGCLLYGLEVAPAYLDPESGAPYPRILRMLRRRLSIALKHFFFEFARSLTRAEPAHYHVLGRRAVVKAVWESDRILAGVSESFEFLLQLTPSNGQQAWKQFERSRFQRAPALRYRPLSSDPVVLKRRLFEAPVERIEDPALALIFRQKLEEVDRQITMLQERNSRRFLHESIQLFGGVEEDLHELALALLEALPPRSREKASGQTVDAAAFARIARREIAHLRSRRPEVSARVRIRPDVGGLLVSRGNLLVDSSLSIPASRVEALIQHEVGTHVLTFHNGRAQKLRLLSSGFAGYDALQEGLAVLSEYLVGGLSRPRLRLLAGRVAATRCLLDGATFVETFHRLWKTHGFPQRTAFAVTLRVYRGGGLTKDAVYLAGLRQILKYVADGGSLELLYVGKIALGHVPIIRELTWRKVLVKPPLLPRHLQQPDARARLERLRRGARVEDLLKG